MDNLDPSTRDPLLARWRFRYRLAHRLRWQLLASYIPLVLIPILIVSVSIRGATERGIAQFVVNQRAQEIANQLGTFYQLNGNSWRGLELLLRRVAQQQPQADQDTAATNPGGKEPRPPKEGNPNPTAPEALETPEANAGYIFPRLANLVRGRGPVVMADATGKVVIASINGPIRGRPFPADMRAQAIPVVANSNVVAYLFLETGQGIIAGQPINEPDPERQELIDTVTRSLVMAGLASSVLMLVVGVWLSAQLTAPIRRLREGVARLASGQWRDPLPITTGNEIGQLTHAFNHMAGEITRQETLRRQMVADIAHDLRTPLSVMALEVEAIRDGLQTPEQAATSLSEEIVTLRKLVDDLHTLSLLDAGQITLQAEPIDLGVFLSGIYTRWRPVAEHADHRLQLDLRFTPPAQTPVVMLDTPRMRQILGNLLGNAIQHTRAGTTVQIAASQADPGALQGDAQGKQAVAITVSDDGDGIPTADLPHIFNRFYRADRSRGRKKNSADKGSGLGLSIAYQLTTLHGGTLTVESEPGCGTLFRVVLPV